MEGSIAIIVAIIFLVLVINVFLLFTRIRRGDNKRKRMSRATVDEAKQALWRDREVARRIEREQDDALERVKLRNETLGYYEQVRRRHAKSDELESLGLGSYETESDNKLETLDLDSYLADYNADSGYTDSDDSDPFDIFKNNK